MARMSKAGLAAVACLLAAACTGGTTDSAGGGGGGADAGDVTLRYLIEQQEDATAQAALQKHITADFTEQSGIEVEVESQPLEVMRTVLQTQLRSGEGPDVFAWGSGPGFGGALAEAGLVMDLTQAYEDNDWEVYDFAKDRVTVDGKVYGLPGEAETIGLFYNKDVFAELGIDEPQSLADVEAASRTVREAGLTPMAVGDKEGWEGGHLLSMALSSAVGSEGMEALVSGEKPWTSPEVVQALELWRGFNEAGYLPKSPTGVDYDTSTAQFYSGEAAMIPTGSWLVAELEDNADFEVGYVPFPAPGGPGIFAGGLGSGPYVSANTDHEQESLEFLDFLASPEHATWVVENLATIPPREVETQGVEVSPLFAQVLEDTAQLSTSGDFGYNIDVLVSDAFNEAMYDGMQAVFTGQATPAQVAANLEAARS